MGKVSIKTKFSDGVLISIMNSSLLFATVSDCLITSEIKVFATDTPDIYWIFRDGKAQVKWAVTTAIGCICSNFRQRNILV